MDINTIDFSTFIMSLASNAYCCLGLIENPISKTTEKNLVSAKQQIDLIELLKEKTKNNLSIEETRILDSALFQLKSTYIKLINEK